jgi:hypothetical protein
MSLCCQSLTDLGDDELNLPKAQFITTSGGCFHCILATCQNKATQNNCNFKKEDMNGTDTNRNNIIRMEWIQTMQTGTMQYEQKGSDDADRNERER